MAIKNPNELLFLVTLRWTLHGQNCQNGFYFTNRADQDDSPSSLSSFIAETVAQFRIRILPAIKNLVNNDVNFRSIIGNTIIPHNGPIAEQVLEIETGDQGDESLPSYCAAILTLRTGLGGKSNRGRIYFGGIGENDTADSRLGPDTFVALQNVGNQLLNNFGPTGSYPFLSFVIWSRLLGQDENNQPPQNPFGIRHVTQCLARSVLGTQRHRMVGKGS